MKIELWSVDPRKLLQNVTTNSDGRTDQSLLSPNGSRRGNYEFIPALKLIDQGTGRRGEFEVTSLFEG